MSSKFVLQQEDGTIANGDARGINAVDLQMSRTVNDQVSNAIGSTISGGYNNKIHPFSLYGTVVGGRGNISGDQFAISGGEANQANGRWTVAFGQSNIAQSQGTAVFGRSNSSNGDDAVIFGNGNTILFGSSQSGILSGLANVVSSSRSVVCGGQQNTASTNTHATVVGGNSNTASGQYSVAGGYNNVASGYNAIALGYSNSVSGGETSVALGRVNTISGWRSFAAGDSNNVSGSSSTALGRQLIISGNNAFSTGYYNYVYGEFGAAFGHEASASPYGAIANANGKFQYEGDAQVVRLLARKQATLTTGATTKLSLDGTGTTNLIDFGFNSDRTVSMPVRITWSAGVNNPLTSGLTKGDCIGQTDQIMLKKVYGGNISIVGTTTTLATNSDATMSTCTMNYSVNSYGELILEFQAPTFGGGGNLNIRVLANIEATQCIVAPF